MIVARYGEIHLKGKNRALFVSALTRNLRERLDKLCHVALADCRYVLTDYKPADLDQIIDITKSTFGLTSLSVVTETTHDKILAEVAKIPMTNRTFKVIVNRADKKFAQTSMDFAAQCGEVILGACPTARVDVRAPQTAVNVDIRLNNVAYIYTDAIECVGGLPVGTSGRALVLLSGGIDSPVASYLIAKRGMNVDVLHFSSPPYTSALGLDKVKRLAKRLEQYCGAIKFHEISTTEFLKSVRAKCNESYTITLLRRHMIREARRIAIENHCDCIVTGENLAQVASQTVQGIASNNLLALDVPILRPLITFDKIEIIALAKKIGTYDISIEPHQDCCTVFVPSSPVIAPTIIACEREEAKLDNAPKA